MYPLKCKIYNLISEWVQMYMRVLICIIIRIIDDYNMQYNQYHMRSSMQVVICQGQGLNLQGIRFFLNISNGY